MDGQPTRVRFRMILLESATLGALAVLALWLPWARASQPTDAEADTLAKQAEDQAIELRSASIEIRLRRSFSRVKNKPEVCHRTEEKVTDDVISLKRRKAN